MTEPLRILILEDNPVDAELIQFELQEAGLIFTAKVVATEKEYIQAIQDYCSDLILSDYDLPTYNGALALAEAKRTCPDIPFILVTGAVSEDRAIEILTQGAKDYVLKTRLEQRLVPAVRRALAEAEEHQARRQAEAELREAHRSLEERVKIRTAELEFEIAERKKLDEALQDSEKRYRRLFEAAKDGILILDANSGKVVDVNPFLLQLLGYSYDEMCGKYLWEIGEFEDIAASKEAFKTLQDSEYIRYEDLPLETRNGQSIAVEFISNVYLIDHHKIIQCNIRNITERKRLEGILKESEKKYRELVKYAPIGIYEIDFQSRKLVTINDAMILLTGYTREEMLAMDVLNILDDESKKAFTARIGKMLKGEKQDENVEYKVIAKDGHIIHAIMHVSFKINEQGIPIGATVIGLDITERKQADELLQKTIQRLQVLVSGMRNSILLVEEDCVEIANQALCDYFDLRESPQDLIGLSAPEMIEKIKNAYLHPEEEVTRIREIVKRGQPVIGEEIAMQGGKTCLRDFIPMILNGKAYERLWIHTDITERKQAEEALKKQARQPGDANK